MSKKQMGGEGAESYKGTKTDKGLGQLGGEGSSVSKGGKSTLLDPYKEKDYCGPGRKI